MDATKIPISVTSQTYWNIVNNGSPGALTLYLFYTQKAIDQNTIQPWAKDSFCARRLKVNTSTITRWRKELQDLGMIEHIRKMYSGKNYFYVKVNYLAVTIHGQAHHMSDNMSGEECNSYMALDYYAKWLESFRESTKFIKDVSQELKDSPDLETIAGAVDEVWNRINEKGYGISEVDTELRFYYYIVTGVANQIMQMKKTKMRVA